MELKSVLNEMIPEWERIFIERYSLLENISIYEPVGRRILCEKTGIKEREIRKDCETLNSLGLIEIGKEGMSLSSSGKNLMKNAYSLYNEIKKNNDKYRKLKEKLFLNDLIVVEGDLKKDSRVLNKMGREASSYILSVIKDGDIIGVTGGTSTAKAVEFFPKQSRKYDLIVVPARGGQGRSVEYQANTIAAELALKLNSEYRLLNIPDNLERSLHGILVKDPDIRETLDLISRINVLIFGMGNAESVAKRRGSPNDRLEFLIERGAVGEAFGRFYDIEGVQVCDKNPIGLSREELENIDTKVGIAGGEDKAEAIVSICRSIKGLTLITDSGAADKMGDII